MKIGNTIEYRCDFNAAEYPLAVIKFLRRLWRDLKTERSIARQNARFVEQLRKLGAPIKLEFGAGSMKGTNGWTTVDLANGCDLQLNVTESLPFAGGEVTAIYSSHLLEHLEYHELMKFLSECFRILRSGGSLSVAVPNARLFVDAYKHPEAFDVNLFCQYKPALHFNSSIDYLNYIAYMDGQHKFMFDEENLPAVLRSVGFGNVSLREFDPVLDKRERDYESVYAIAVK